ncbi:serine hydrolase domain-containing protein [Pseudoalteromonas sp. BDTF-M6]|uniref:serine hydrolase domain-containing protein n=1 Tax=Pseudoalteromonas sp. BDTF-M6 TaxID=2796132 RepID=UPI001BB048F1|nr:serine hydrolase domain-containing protein [Pseudoalteromonas sp. BDTF-M6]MBS3798682.1 beta-lactamase family protein [Pseudoalteromonas sp. BDTF-M6]
MLRKLLFSSLFFVSCVDAQEHDFPTILSCHASSDKPGLAVSIEQSGKHVFKGALGVADLSTRELLRVDDTFQIGSISKQFTAAAILQLAENKKLSLKSTLGDFITDIPVEYASLTIESVLSHTSGLPNYNSDTEVRQRWDKYAPIDEVINVVSKMPVLAKPGVDYAYSNTGYILLGKVIEVASGLTYSEYLQRNIFSPLGMKNSFVVTKGVSSKRIVKGYTSNRNAPDLYVAPENVDRSWIYAAGAIASTLDDMSLWHRGLSSGKVISAENYQLMVTRAKLNNGESVNYGFGTDVYPISDQPSYSHQGQVPGFMAWSVYFPSHDLLGTVFGNNDAVHPGPALLNMIARQLNLSPAPIAEKDITEQAKALIGTYKGADDTVMTVTFDNGQLSAKNGNGVMQKLVLRENNSFSYECTEDYYQLREQDDKRLLVPVSIYMGERAPLVRMEI